MRAEAYASSLISNSGVICSEDLVLAWDGQERRAYSLDQSTLNESSYQKQSNTSVLGTAMPIVPHQMTGSAQRFGADGLAMSQSDYESKLRQYETVDGNDLEDSSLSIKVVQS